MKTANLEGAALDWAVLKAIFPGAGGQTYWVELAKKERHSEDWALSGPIIEREKLMVTYEGNGVWLAGGYDGCVYKANYAGPTPLIAAMRTYAASKLGDEVDIPEELL